MTTGVKRDAKGEAKKNLTVIVLDKDGKPQSISGSRTSTGGAVVGESEGGNEWMLGFIYLICICLQFLHRHFVFDLFPCHFASS